MTKYRFHSSPNAPWDLTSHALSRLALSRMIRHSLSCIASKRGVRSLPYTLIATSTGDDVPKTLAMATRPNAPTSMSPSTRYWRSPSRRMGVGGPKRVPLRTCEMRVSVDLDARVEHEDEVGGDDAGEADDAGDAEDEGDAEDGGESDDD